MKKKKTKGGRSPFFFFSSFFVCEHVCLVGKLFEAPTDTQQSSHSIIERG